MQVLQNQGLVVGLQVYLTPSDLGWEPFVRTWLSSLPEELYSDKALRGALLFRD